ncbi:MAG: hypothetical protein IM631_05120 [Cytophagales bacterium]|nr:hypothetical protein [Cytophagales bacterium]MCA6370762.1 hypothetical protein [Cytophagales bacterium]MCA6385924.1 hypothetical protein [Cytophagales bacterium]
MLSLLDITKKYFPFRLANEIPSIKQLVSVFNKERVTGSILNFEKLFKQHMALNKRMCTDESAFHKSATVSSYARFYNAGSNVFDLSGSLINLLDKTDVGSVLFDDIKLPYSNFYISLLDGGYRLKENQLLDGIYVYSATYDDDAPNKYALVFVLCAYDETLSEQNQQFALSNNEYTDVLFLNFINAQSSVSDAIEFHKEWFIKAETQESSINAGLEGLKLLGDFVKLFVNTLLYLSLPNIDITELELIGKKDNLLPTSKDKKNTLKSKNKRYGDRPSIIKRVGFTRFDQTLKSLSLSSPRSLAPHWRRGHWRNQPFGGVNERERKLIWIQPTFIGDDHQSDVPGHIYKD